jgi:hypothetical protein
VKVNEKNVYGKFPNYFRCLVMAKTPRRPRPQWAARLTNAFAGAGFAVDCTRDRERLGEMFRVHQMTIKSWTDGRTEPRFEHLVKVQQVTEVSVDWILCVPGSRPHK